MISPSYDKVSGSVDSITVTRPFISLGLSTAYIAQSDTETVVIDSGPHGSQSKILNRMETLRLAARPLQALLLTHAHADHAGAATGLLACAKAPLVAHGLEAQLLETGAAKRVMHPKPDLMSRLLFWHYVTRGPQAIEPVHVDLAINDCDVLPWLGGIQVVSLPGHSAGQVGYLIQKSGDFFVGDAIMTAPWPRRIRWQEDEQAEAASVGSIARLDWRALHPGHGPRISRRTFNFFFRNLF
jgi:glyoxylase-like metal-dependent hydrolase (beta-lactamase superfamily II)